MIIITGGTGKVGRELVTLCKVSNIPFKVMTRDRRTAQKNLGRDVSCITGDLQRSATLKAAFGSATRLFLTAPIDNAFEKSLTDAIQVAKNVGITHIALLSAADILMTDEANSKFGQQAWRVEEALIQSNIDYTILRPNYLMQSIGVDNGKLIRTRRLMRTFVPENAPVSMVDARDVAGVAYAALVYSGHRGETYTLTGRSTSMRSIVEKLSNRVGEAVSYEWVRGARASISSTQEGHSRWLVDTQKDWGQVLARGGGGFTTKTVEEVTGYPARTIDEYIADHIDQFS